MATSDIHWLAGLLEGEGCFSLVEGRYLRIDLHSTDKDVLYKAAHILKAKIFRPYKPGKSGKKMRWVIQMTNSPVVATWMKRLYPLMGLRRKKKIKLALKIWRQKRVKYY